jgi:hypothetical protein
VCIPIKVLNVLSYSTGFTCNPISKLDGAAPAGGDIVKRRHLHPKSAPPKRSCIFVSTY